MTTSTLPRRTIVTTHHFPENRSLKHFIVNRSSGETDDTLSVQMHNLIENHPDSLVLVVERSLILKPDGKGNYTDIIRSRDEIFDHQIMRGNKLKLRPHPGHIFAILTRSSDSLSEQIEISLRPGANTILSEGQTTMHESLYGKMTSSIRSSRYSSATEEFQVLSKIIGKQNNYIRADITVIPLSLCKINRAELINNTTSLFNNRLYHLCMSIYKKESVDSITDEIVEEQIKKLIIASQEIASSQKNMHLEAGFVSAAALACAHAIVQTIFADYHHLEKKYGQDLDVQTVSTYITMALTGYIDFRQFAKDVGLIQIASEIVEESNAIARLQ